MHSHTYHKYERVYVCVLANSTRYQSESSKSAFTSDGYTHYQRATIIAAITTATTMTKTTKCEDQKENDDNDNSTQLAKSNITSTLAWQETRYFHCIEHGKYRCHFLHLLCPMEFIYPPFRICWFFMLLRSFLNFVCLLKSY